MLFDGFDPVALGFVIDFKLSFLARFLAKERLTKRREITEDWIVGIAVPSAKDDKGLRLVCAEVRHADLVADGDLVCRGIGEVGASGACQVDLQLALAGHQQFLHFLGCLELVVLAQIAVASGDGDFLRVGRDLLLDQFHVLEFSPLKAGPGNNEGVVFLGLFAGNHLLNGRERLDDATQQRAFVHVVKAVGRL